MKKHSILSAVFMGIFIYFAQNAVANNFNKLWYDGNAEISVYDLVETRYGEKRDGKRVMVFVTEPLRTKSLIKPDSKLRDKDKIEVIKLNDVSLQFGLTIGESRSFLYALLHKGLIKADLGREDLSANPSLWCPA